MMKPLLQNQEQTDRLNQPSGLKHSSYLKPTVPAEKDLSNPLQSAILSMQKTYGNRYVQELVSGERMPCPELCGRSEPLTTSPTRPAAQFKPHSCDSCVFHPQRSVKRAATGASNPPGGISLQTKLKIGQPGDVYEQEADKVADTVLQRQCITPECEEEEEVLQMKQTSGTIESDQDVIGQILQHKGSGRPLEPDVREFMESRFGYDFGDVKIHTDSHAAETSEKLGAEAFTVGEDMYFGSGRYDPVSIQGKKLLGHELTHVVQQNRKMSSSHIGHIKQCTSVPSIQFTTVTVEKGCPGTEAELRRAIGEASNGIKRIADEEAKECLRKELEDANIVCSKGDGCGWARYVGSTIRIYNWGGGCPLLPALIVHETAHKCKFFWTEKFAEACENEAFGGRGATPPEPGEEGGTCEL